MFKSNPQLFFPFLWGFSIAENLYASHYSGTISYLTLAESAGSYSLTQTSSIQGCGALPSWLTYNAAQSMLYCSDETMYGSASLSAFSAASNGALTQTAKVSTQPGGVANVLYGGTDGAGFIAIAH